MMSITIIIHIHTQVLRERLGVHCVLGLTATATHTTIGDMIEHFDIHQDNVITRGSILPDHLNISVTCEEDKDKVIGIINERFSIMPVM